MVPSLRGSLIFCPPPPLQNLKVNIEIQLWGQIKLASRLVGGGALYGYHEIKQIFANKYQPKGEESRRIN